MATIINGKDVSFHIYDNGSWKLYACARSCSISVTTSTIEVSTTGSGDWVSVKPQKHAWSASIDGVVNLDESGMLNIASLRALQIAKTELLIRYERVDELGNGYTDQGYAYITSSSDSGPFDNVATFSIELQGTGELTQHT